MEQKEIKEPPHRIVNDRKVFDVTTTTDAVKRPQKGQENEAKNTAVSD